MSTRVNPFQPPRTTLELRRSIGDLLARVLTTLFVLFAAGILVFLLLYVLQQGIHYLNLDFFTQLPTAPGDPGGGMGQSVQGSLILVGLASLSGIPLGLFTGIYLSELGRGRLTAVIRFLVDILAGIPSIIFGLFVWVLIVVPSHTYSGLAGGIALGIIMIPIVARTTEDALRLVPHELREASLALGATQTRTILRVVLPAASSGIVTGILLSMARVAGEAAPLLMTAFGSSFWNTDITLPMDALPLRVFAFVGIPFQEKVQQAYAGAFILVLLVCLTSLVVRLATGGFVSRQTPR